MEKEMKVINRWELQNPDGKFVRHATITQMDASNPAFSPFCLTIYFFSQNTVYYYKTLRGAKIAYSKDATPGGKWKQV
jgi:hypothetical protein